MESHKLVGAQRAAAVLLALGKDSTTQLLRHFSPEELREVTIAAARLGDVPIGELETIVEQFTAEFVEGASVLGDEGQIRALLADAATPDQITDYLSNTDPNAPPNVWLAAKELPDPMLVEFLKEEHPLTATYIVSRLDAGQSARVVALLPRELRNQVLCRLITPPVLSPAALVMLENAMRDTLIGDASASSSDDNRSRIADIINGLEATEAEDVMRTLDGTRPVDARVIRKMLFTFNDLPRLSQRARSLLFDKLPTELVVAALRGTESEFREPVLAAMASRSRRLVESELANPSSSPASETSKARKEIVTTVLMMSQSGQIELPSSDAAAVADAA